MERPRSNLPWVMVFGAVALFAGLALAGVPLGSLLVIGLLLMCPLMMAGMHMGSGHGDYAQNGDGHVHDDPRVVNPPRPDRHEPQQHAGME